MGNSVYRTLLLIGGVLVALSAMAIKTRVTSSSVTATNSGKADSERLIVEAYDRQLLGFEAADAPDNSFVDFVSHAARYDVGVAATGASIFFRRPGSESSNGKSAADDKGAIRMKLLDSNPRAAKAATDELPTKVNYFLGRDPSRWRTNVKSYEKVRYRNIYQGIDLVYYGNQRELEYDFVVAPGAKADAIAFDITGANRLALDAAGNLSLFSDPSSKQLVSLRAPLLYQEVNGERRRVSGTYLVDGTRVSFQVGRYDRSRQLVIDPVFAYSKEISSAENQSGWAIAINAKGEAYVTGDTNVSDFPLNHSEQKTYGGSTDAFVARLSADGTKLLSSTYIGGSAADVGYGIAVDKAGNIYVTGDTSSTDFPVVNPMQGTLGGGVDVFVAKLSPDGSKLLYSTYIGGSQGERGNSIAVDDSGNAYVAGYTNSSNFPTVAPIRATFAGGPADAFIFKLNASGSSLAYSTYLGGGPARPSIATAVAVDSSGNAYITGFTNSPNFPVLNPMQKFIGPTDVFVTKVNAAGSALVYSTFLGGKADEEAMGIAVDSQGNAYVTGETESLDFPTTPGAFATSCVPVDTPAPMRQICSGGDGFITKINSEGSALVYSTYLRGTHFEVGRSIAVDSEGSAYVTGFTGSDNFVTVDAPQRTYGGGKFDAFVLKMNPSGSALIYSTYLGGKGVEGGYGIAVDPAENAYVTGYTTSLDFPLRKKGGKSHLEEDNPPRSIFITKIAKEQSH